MPPCLILLFATNMIILINNDRLFMDTEKKFHELKNLIMEAGKLAFGYFDSADTGNKQKSDGSVVTEVDINIEKILIEYIKKNFPDDAIIGEEHGEHIGQSGFVWHIDPIDGTDNFLRKIPFCAISVARLGDSAADSFGIVYNPITKQIFSSFMETEGGVYENERVLNLTAEPLGGKYVITVASSGKEKWMRPATYALRAGLGMKYGKSSSYSCTALELAYIAANRIDAYLSFGLKSYDYAAGLFLVKAAGASISVFENEKWKLWTGNLKELCSKHERILFTSHPDIHLEMLDFIGDPARWAKK